MSYWLMEQWNSVVEQLLQCITVENFEIKLDFFWKNNLNTVSFDSLMLKIGFDIVYLCAKFDDLVSAVS